MLHSKIVRNTLSEIENDINILHGEGWYIPTGEYIRLSGIMYPTEAYGISQSEPEFFLRMEKIEK